MCKLEMLARVCVRFLQGGSWSRAEASSAPGRWVQLVNVVSRGVSLPPPWGWVVWLRAKISRAPC